METRGHRHLADRPVRQRSRLGVGRESGCTSRRPRQRRRARAHGHGRRRRPRSRRRRDRLVHLRFDGRVEQRPRPDGRRRRVGRAAAATMFAIDLDDITIPAGAAATTVQVQLRSDGFVEGDEQLALTVVADPDDDPTDPTYLPGDPAAASIVMELRNDLAQADGAGRRRRRRGFEGVVRHRRRQRRSRPTPRSTTSSTARPARATTSRPCRAR